MYTASCFWFILIIKSAFQLHVVPIIILQVQMTESASCLPWFCFCTYTVILLFCVVNILRNHALSQSNAYISIWLITTLRAIGSFLSWEFLFPHVVLYMAFLKFSMASLMFCFLVLCSLESSMAKVMNTCENFSAYFLSMFVSCLAPIHLCYHS